MPAGELFINGVDAFNTWGVSMDSTALSTLMTPVPLKGMIENKSALENGKRVIRTERRIDERTMTLNINISAPSKSLFFERYELFCRQVLANGQINIKTRYQSDVEYHLDYLSCQSFSEYCQSIGKFALRVVEANPSDRTVTNYSNGE